MVCFDDFDRLCVEDVPNMDAWARSALTSSYETLHWMYGKASYLKSVTFIESLCVSFWVVNYSYP